jgi:rhamnogalacturonan endolyase
MLIYVFESLSTTFLNPYLLSILIAVSPASVAWAEFGLTSDKKQHSLDSGTGLVISIDKDNGSIRSMKWLGEELNSAHRTSGLNSGLGSEGTSVSTRVEGDIIVATVQTDATNGVCADLTQSYIMRKGDNTLYITTFATNEPSNGELRFIARLKGELFPEVPEHSNLRGTTHAVESKDVFGLGDGITRSKYYGNDQARDLGIRGVTGPGRGVFMVYGSRESSAGGPFYRDIQNQSGNTAEVYNYLNSGHNQTEKLRLGTLFGPYALCFTQGSKPKAPDMKFISKLGIKGFVNDDHRGIVILNDIKGHRSGFDYTVAFANATAQYWTAVRGLGGSADCQSMKPGSYMMTIFKGELAVHSETVTVEAGKATTLNSRVIQADPSAIEAIWRIGDWDGTPLEFRNGDNIALMHPSDVRQAAWKCGDFVIGKSKLTDFPACQWMRVNGQQVVKFTLTPEQLSDHTLRIGITASFSGARPRMRVNEWESKLLPAPRKIDSRSLTIGSYRGHNATFTFNVPAKALRAGDNTLTISVVSGNTAEDFLSPGYSIDCIDFH